jgi:hypothetical protein
MPFPFDATLKELVQAYLPDYEKQLGLEDLGPLRPLNVDLSTVTAATDVALGHGDPPDRIVDLNFQSGPDNELASRTLLYSALLYHRYQVPVHSVLVLLRPVADHSVLTGKLHYEGRRRKGKMDFKYEVVRLWEQSARRYLRGGLGTLPLAPLCRTPPESTVEEGLAPVVRKIIERLSTEASQADRAKLLTATYILTGLRTSPDVSDRLFAEVSSMVESSTYQKILRDGEIKALHKSLLVLGNRKFGRATDESQARLIAVKDLDHLMRMTERVLFVASWDELLDTP